MFCDLKFLVVKDDRVSYYTLRRAYKHDLGIEGKHFTAFNMICGPFGGVRGRDMILVQSIDGKLQIFEQSAHSFSRQLLDCLIPGPLKYIPKRDAFVTVNYAGIAECYLYQTLAASQSDIGAKSESKSDAMGSFGLKGIRSANVEWSLNLGEQCRDILLGNFSVDIDSIGSGSAPSHANELLMVCEKSVFLVKAETGGVIQQRRLDRSEAACACTVPHIPNDSSQSQNSPNYNFLVAGQDGTIQVFSGFHLVWAARLTFTPIHMEVATFGGTKGLIVAVDDSGMLTVNFLGTKPPVTTVLTQVRDLDYDKIDEEHRMLLQIIRESQNESKGEVLDKLLIKSQIPKTFDMEPTTLPDLPVNSFVPIHPPNTTLHHDGQFVKICVRFFFSHNGERPVHNVSVSLSSPQHIYITPRQFVIPKVANLKSTPVVQKVTFYALKTYLPTSMEITATASYQSSNKGEPQIVAHHISLPLCMALRPKAPSKNAAYKVIVDTEYPAIPLTELFGDVLYAYQQAGYLDNIQESIGSNAVQAMGFQFFCNPTNSLSGSSGVNGSNLVSILVSKNAGRYRLQADSYELLALMMQELGQRLQNRINAQNQTSLPLSSIVKYNDVLPIDEYFAVIHTHLICRLRLQNFNAQLNDAAHQYRLIEKRLLVRFKDRNPTPLHGLDIILKESYDRIIRLADDIQSQQQKLKAMSNEIDCFSRLMSNLICMKYGLSIVDYAALQSYLCPEINDGVEQVNHFSYWCFIFIPSFCRAGKKRFTHH